jgi:hypothetical protein
VTRSEAGRLRKSEQFRDCANDRLREQAGEGVTFGDVRVGQVSFPRLGDRSSAWKVVIPFESQGISETHTSTPSTSGQEAP